MGLIGLGMKDVNELNGGKLPVLALMQGREFWPYPNSVRASKKRLQTLLGQTPEEGIWHV
jgi:hypothetical protein